MTTTPDLLGGCQCRAVRYRVTGAPIAAALCHCSMCRRANAAPSVAWAMYQQLQVDFLSLHPTVYESSPGCRRGFCPRCGTQIMFAADYLPGLVDLTIGSFDDPAALAPAFQYWHAERLQWFETVEQLPSYAEFPPSEVLWPD